MSKTSKIRGLFVFLELDREFRNDICLGRLLLIAALAWCVMFGLGAAIAFDGEIRGQDRALAKTFSPLFALGYGTEGQSSITVVTIGDDDLKEYGQTWPASQSWYARRITEMLPYAPKAIFIDLVFPGDEPRGGEERLVKAACEARLKNTPVYVGSINSPATLSATERIYSQARVDIDGRQVPCIDLVGVEISPDRADQTMWKYDLKLPEQYPAAALQMYCASSEQAGETAVCKRAGETNLSMELLWSSSPHPMSSRFAFRQNRQHESVFTCRSEWFWHDYIPVLGSYLAVSRSDSEGTGVPRSVLSYPLCPSHHWILARELNPLYADSGSLQTRESLNGKFVILGSQLDASNDLVVSPVNGTLPGVFLHAMALDNLLTMHGHPLTLNNTVDGTPSDDEKDFNLLGGCLVFLFVFGSLLFDHKVLTHPFVQNRLNPLAERLWFHAMLGRAGATAMLLIGGYALYERNVALIALLLVFIAGLIYRQMTNAAQTTAADDLRLALNIISATMKLALALVLFKIIITAGLHWLHIGPLSMVVFMVFGILFDWAKAGEKVLDFFAPQQPKQNAAN